MKKIINFFKKNSILDNLSIIINIIAIIINFISGFLTGNLYCIFISIMFILITFQEILIINYRNLTNEIIQERKKFIDAFTQFNK